MKWLLGGCLFLIALNSNAQTICQRTQDELRAAFFDPQERIAIRNNGGIANGGVCWWHSRLQRAAIYLTSYAPSKTKPSSAEARAIILKITLMREVVEIPGFRNFFDFSTEFAKEVQVELNAWQIRDGFIFQQWVRGLSGKSSMPSEELAEHMDAIYSDFKTHAPGLWVMAQMKGITSHALLIIGMTPTADGYDLMVIDSNHPAENTLISYHHGDTSVSQYSMVPYTGFNSDYVRIEHALAKECER